MTLQATAVEEMDSDKLLTIHDLCRIYRVSKDTVAKLISLGEIPEGSKFGRSRRWHPKAIRESIEAKFGMEQAEPV